MRALRIAAVALLLLSGTLSTACAQADKPAPPPFGEPPPEPPNPPPPPFGQDPDSKGPPRDRIRHLEAEIHELEAALENKDASPEQRKRWEQRLLIARGELRAALKPQEALKEHQERLMARLRELEGLMKKAGPEEQKELMAQMEKIRGELKRGGMPIMGKGPPMDPEMHKLHVQIKEMEQQSQELGMKLRSLPAESKEDRATVQAQLKEAVTKLFDLREQARAKEVEDLKRRLEELTRLLEKRKANRDQIIERRIRQLSGELDELDW